MRPDLRRPDMKYRRGGVEMTFPEYRLECLKLAVAIAQPESDNVDDILIMAREFESYVTGLSNGVFTDRADDDGVRP